MNLFAGTESRWRRARGRLLHQHIATLAEHLGRDIVILDIGGRHGYWRNMAGLQHIAQIRLLTHDQEEFERNAAHAVGQTMWVNEMGDARNLANYADQSVDLVHSNSVIEHVGYWTEQSAMAASALRVGLSGWIQTPAFEFPIEPHFKLPFIHWLGQPLRRSLLSMSKYYRGNTLAVRRWHVDRVNLLSYAEVVTLFPNCNISIERWVLLPKSYVVRWFPAGVSL